MTEQKNDRKKMNRRLKFWVQAAVIAAIYATLTIILSPISYGPMQVRISEALTVLPFFTPAAIPGLFMGCLLSNIISPYGIADMVCGSIATLVAACISYKVRKFPSLVPLPPVILNGAIIGSMIYFVYGLGEMSIWASMLWVAAGELLACYILGYPILKYFQKRKNILSLDDNE